MHSEFYSWLRSSLRELPALQPDFTDFEVADCPYPDLALLSSNIAFTVSRKLSALQSGSEVPPAPVASQFAAFGREEFAITVGGDGFLNAMPSAALISVYLQKLIAGEGLWGLSPLVQIGASESRKISVPENPNFNEKGLRNLLSKREEAKRFLQSPRSARERDDALMLLAILADAELDSGAYRKGLYGSENVPWYLERFSQDLRRIVTELTESEIASYASAATPFPHSARFRWLLLSREVIAQAALFGRPDLIFARLLVGVRLFYESFNRPEIRVSERTPGGIEAALFGSVVKKFLDSTLPRLEICCESLRSVLHR